MNVWLSTCIVSAPSGGRGAVGASVVFVIQSLLVNIWNKKISVTSLRDWLRLSGVSPKEAGRSNKDAKRIRELEAQVREIRKQSIEKDDVIAVLKSPQ